MNGRGESMTYRLMPRAMRRMNWIGILFMVLLLAMGWGSIYALYEHGASGPRSEPAAESTEAR